MPLRVRLRVYALIIAAVVAAALSQATAVRAQTPDRRGEVVTRVPEYRGERASAPIPPGQHVRNEGGSDGAGLCVISSMLANGQYQEVPGLEGAKQSQFWQTAKSRPGGYGPDKLIGLIRETLPGEKYASLLNASPEDLDRLSRAGYPIGGVMAWGQGYPGRISHMISLAHYRKDGNACIVDNNFPGEYHWMPAAEYDARFRANGSWAFIWTRLPTPAVITLTAAGIGAAVLFGLAGAQLLAAAGLLAHESQEPDPYFDPIPIPEK